MKFEKLSISLPCETTQFLDEYRRRHGLKGRSEVIGRAIDLLRNVDLRAQYRESNAEDRKYGYSRDWECTVGDGLTDEAW